MADHAEFCDKCAPLAARLLEIERTTREVIDGAVVNCTVIDGHRIMWDGSWVVTADAMSRLGLLFEVKVERPKGAADG